MSFNYFLVLITISICLNKIALGYSVNPDNVQKIESFTDIEVADESDEPKQLDELEKILDSLKRRYAELIRQDSIVRLLLIEIFVQINFFCVFK